ncbi:MAG TPA: cytochrome bc complex cytochrome b subunit [Candidatus Kapabacteria bacterium]|jgi:cytochrome b6|nr:cytochrome bc complex cytochrome b subunit [Candidatus Kapabacteria bacterium]
MDKIAALPTTRQWIDDRVGLEPLRELARKKEVPIYRHTVWYYLGGMTLFLFSVQVVTGILLLLYYKPSAAEAFESVQFISAEVSFGWLVRSVHSWSANLMVATLFTHLLSVFLLKAYRPPRELTWVTGMILFFVVLGFGFSGYLLPWNSLAFFATKVGTDIAGAIPVVGPDLMRFLRGGDDVSGATLTRFYGFHVAVLPAITTLLVVAHLFLVQRHGMSVSPAWEKRPLRRMKFVPSFIMRDAVGWLIALGILAALAAMMPWELGTKADPFSSAPVGIKPEWFFMFMFQTLKMLPAHVLWMEGETFGVVAFGLVGLFFLFAPFLDRRTARGLRSPVFTIIGVVAILYIVVLTVLGYMN